MANTRLSSRVRAGARALTTPTRDLHLLEHDDHEEIIMNNHRLQLGSGPPSFQYLPPNMMGAGAWGMVSSPFDQAE